METDTTLDEFVATIYILQMIIKSLGVYDPEIEAELKAIEDNSTPVIQNIDYIRLLHSYYTILPTGVAFECPGIDFECNLSDYRKSHYIALYFNYREKFFKLKREVKQNEKEN